MEALSWGVIALVLACTARRLVLLLGALLPARPVGGEYEPSMLVVVAAHNELSDAEPLLASLDGLEYAEGKLRFVLISDGSTDGTAEVFQRWAQGRAHVEAIGIRDRAGKAAAINQALRSAQPTELFVVYDADQRPRADSLRKLARAFSDARVGAASGYRSPSNAERGMVSRYAALEAWVHQFMVMGGKDKWGWNPPTMGGNCVYRRAAVVECGYFPDPTSSEDVEVSLELIARGWRTRFVREAVADSRVAQTMRHYASQRLRWGYGMYGSAKHARSLEALTVASGYADRLVFTAACAMAVAGKISGLWAAVYLAGPGLQVLAALGKAGRLGSAHEYVGSAVALFVFDIAMTVYSTVLAMLGRRPAWSQFVRAAEGGGAEGRAAEGRAASGKAAGPLS